MGHEAPVRFYVWMDVLEELWFAAGWREEPCVCLLTGLYGIADEGPFVEVTGFEGLDYLEDVEDLLEPMRATMEEMMEGRRTALDSNRPGPVGLFAHLPGSEAELTVEIARVHMTLFNVPYQVALLVDHAAEVFGMYARAPQKPFFNASFHTVAEIAQAHAEQE